MHFEGMSEYEPGERHLPLDDAMGNETLKDDPTRPVEPDIIAASLLYPERSTKLEQVQVEAFHAGGKEPKATIEGRIGGHEVSLIKRPYDKNYFETWKAFREAGLPVVPTLRQGEVDGRQSLLMTDLKVDGSELYGRGLRKTILPIRRHRPPNPEVDSLFLQLTEPDSFSVIEARAHELATLATKNRLILPLDDPFELLVSPDGSWQLVTIDLALAHKAPENDTEVEWTNMEYTDEFLGELQKIRARLIELSTPS